ncbi:UDP-N-acetylmuramate--L-alanine ligase [Thermodesulfobacterium sp.]|uniref:UDP-N-acetylmuramate--L-alanine ligase n=1 Tax=Thermodesulfobacterium sp. TaxID=1965289 RepID=UPI002649D803|nr:Mur ligase family protein [Thermodesulfobacterium sp.]MDN5379429.1 UDP-N-acetylmuramate: L-alanyl-gamma-D-glutamyl-meso-diaminopimelate ligase [Thermodesulfobacterium sp.]
MKVYFIGIGGIGMCGVAGLLKQSGYEVFGSEKGEIYPPASDILKNLGIKVLPFDPENIVKIKPDCVIVGNSVKANHPELLKAQKLNLPLYSFPQFLEKNWFNGKKVLVCAGTHGKSTTTALLSYLMKRGGYSPSFLVGGVLRDEEKNFGYGEGEWMVIEGDEYPSASFDRVPKFFHYKPYAVILTSLEYDHADVYSNLEALKKVFIDMIELLPEDGLLVYNGDDINLNEVVSKANLKAKAVSYGKGEANDFRLLKVDSFLDNQGFMSIFEFSQAYKKEAFQVSLVGEYNVLNTLGVIALLKGLDLFNEDIEEGLKTFPGIKRRQEIIYRDKDLVVVDDFAHHPTAVRLTVGELKKAIKPELTVIFFEPRTNSSKRKIFQQDYVESLSIADVVYLKTPAGIENVPSEDRIDLDRMVEEIKLKGKKAFKLTEEFFSYPRFEWLNYPGKKLVIFMSSAYMEREIKGFLAQLS